MSNTLIRRAAVVKHGLVDCSELTTPRPSTQVEKWEPRCTQMPD